MSDPYKPAGGCGIQSRRSKDSPDLVGAQRRVRRTRHGRPQSGGKPPGSQPVGFAAAAGRTAVAVRLTARQTASPASLHASRALRGAGRRRRASGRRHQSQFLAVTPHSDSDTARRRLRIERLLLRQRRLRIEWLGRLSSRQWWKLGFQWLGRLSLRLQRRREFGRLVELRSGAPKDVSAIAAKVDPALVDIDLTLGYGSGEAAGTGIVMNSLGPRAHQQPRDRWRHCHQRHRCRQRAHLQGDGRRLRS